MSYTKHYKQPNENAIPLDTIADYQFVELEFHSIPRQEVMELFLIPQPEDLRTHEIKNIPLIEMRWGNNQEDCLRVDIEQAIILITDTPEEEPAGDTENYPHLQHAILSAVSRDMIDTNTIGSALLSAHVSGKVKTNQIGELLLSGINWFQDHPGVKERSEAFDAWVGPSEDVGENNDRSHYDEDYDDTDYFDPSTGELREDLLP